MTLLLLMNLGFGGSAVVGPTFLPAWAANANKVVGPVAPQPRT